MAIVYGLADPRSGHLRYVGKTVATLDKRVRGHLAKHELKRNLHRAKWLASLVKVGIRPDAFVLEECDEDSVNEAEVFWIGYLRYIGCDLVNQTAGGDGCLHWKRSLKTIERHRLALKAAYARPEVRLAHAARNALRAKTESGMAHLAEMQRLSAQMRRQRMLVQLEKLCLGCELKKAVSEFPLHDAAGHRSGRCHPCLNIAQNARYAARRAA